MFDQLTDWKNLLEAHRLAARGKRRAAGVARFEHQLADRLLELQEEVRTHHYRPGAYVSFMIHDPKQRKISAAPFRDRVVHHALCRVIEPRFERTFITDSFANRRGKGTHRAVARLEWFARHYQYVLRLDIVKHFPSIDHAILLGILRRQIPETDVLALAGKIIASGAGILDDECPIRWFPGDDLLSVIRPRGLPIGNLTSQFWSNCYLNHFDHFVNTVQGWINHVRHADTWGLREHVLGKPLIRNPPSDQAVR